MYKNTENSLHQNNFFTQLEMIIITMIHFVKKQPHRWYSDFKWPIQVIKKVFFLLIYLRRIPKGHLPLRRFQISICHLLQNSSDRDSMTYKKLNDISEFRPNFSLQSGELFIKTVNIAWEYLKKRKFSSGSTNFDNSLLSKVGKCEF